jgi:hypothetical protein
LTIHSINLTGHPSSARDAARAALDDLQRHEEQLRQYQSKAAPLPELRRQAEAATVALDSYASRAAERGEAPTAEGWLARGEDKRQADAAVRAAERAEQQYLALATERPALVEANKQALKAILAEEVQTLGEQRRRLQRAADRAQAAVDALAHYAAFDIRDSGLAAEIQAAARDLPANSRSDPFAFSRAADARKADLAAFRRAWSELPARLADDPAATAPNPETER